MYVPNSYKDSERTAIRQTLFGTNMSPKLAIITPLKIFFEPLAKRGKYYQGWWKTSLIDNVMVIKSQQGTAVLDSICALDPETHIIFLGIAGSLKNLKIGQIVEPNKAILQDREILSPWVSQNHFLNVSIATVSCLAESNEQFWKLRESADCVDMETGWLFLASHRQRKPSCSIQLISDHPLDSPFYKVNKPFPNDSINKIISFTTQIINQFH